MMNPVNRKEYGGNTRGVMSPAEYGLALLKPGAGWTLAELRADRAEEDAADTTAARDALADPTRLGYDDVRRKLGL